MTSRFSSILLAGPLLAGFSVPALAVDTLEFAGDGSATNNRDLLRGAYECSYDCPSALVPDEPYNPPFDIDWSVALRGSFVEENGVGSFETSLIPALSLSHLGLRSTFDLDAEAELIKAQDTVARIGALRLVIASEYGLDEVTNFATDGTLTITQAPPSDPNNPAGTATSPRILDGDFAAALTRDIGIAYIGVRGTVGRTDYGDTTLVNGTVIDNSSSSNTRFGAGLRLSHRLTPILAGFVDGSAEYRTYDAASPSLLVKFDGTDYELRGGLSAEVGTTLEAEASVGLALRRFADASLADVRATLYDASITFRPTETLTLIGTLGSSIEAPGPNGTGTATIERTATGEARYRVNPWWSVWAAGGWSQESAVAAANVETGYNVGVGSEYQLNRHVALTADYTFSHREVTATPPVDTHKATVGVKVSR